MFDNWMRGTGLSESSVLKYFGAVEGALSDWAREAGVISGSILDITSSIKFESAAHKIRQLPIFLERNSTGHNMYSSAINKYAEFLAKGVVPTVEHDIEVIVSDPTLETTEKIQLVNARIGQGQFRRSLLNYWKHCSVTRYPETSMLVASHIKPWSKSSNIERLDKFNGLLLVPNLDRAFDHGFMSFDYSGNVIISPLLQQPKMLGIEEGMSVSLADYHQDYMEYHRENVFIGS